jgi:hypothetical protein
MPTTPDQTPDKGSTPHLDSVADELQRESERLRRLAEELKARETLQAEMLADYPYFKQAVYAALREQFERELPPLPDKDLEAVAAEENGQPLEAFIEELEEQGGGA